MKLTDKYLGINQPITFKVMDELFYRYFANEDISETVIKKLLQEKILGENRLKKALSQVRILFKNNNELLLKIKESSYIKYSRLSEIERKSLIITFISLTYPVMYKIVNMFGSGFLIHEALNKKYVEEKLAAFYGSNRGIFNALDAVIYTLIDFELLKMQKKGIYNKPEKWIINNTLVNELIIYCETYYSISKTVLQNEVEYKPIFNFYEYPNLEANNFILLDQLALRESEKYYRVKK